MNKKNVIDLFNSISPWYDFCNFILSMGVEKYWRKQFLKKFKGDELKILDACCGTGISSYQIYKKLHKSFVYGLDFSDRMIAIAKKRYGNIVNLEFLSCDVTNLDFQNNYFDCISIVFGIRNIFKRKTALKEFYRVAKLNSKIIIMEFGHINNGFIARLFNFYLQKVLPIIGGFITKNKDAYLYLVETIKKFPKPNDFIKIIESAGWKKVEVYPLTFGTCNIYIGYKI